MPTPEQINAATREFIDNTPEMGAYLTAENIEKLAAYVQGAFPDAIASSSAYESLSDIFSERSSSRESLTTRLRSPPKIALGWNKLPHTWLVSSTRKSEIPHAL